MSRKTVILRYAAIFCAMLVILYLSAGLFFYAALGLYDNKKFICDWERYETEYKAMMENPNDPSLRETYLQKLKASCRHEERSFSEKMTEVRLFAFFGAPLAIMRSIPRIQCQVFGECPVIQKGG